ncbi:Methyltransferase domain-containing protein [Sphingomonas guangdongensis]|uniref:Methyltransferase domain-containing protein n=1 Tax=Sphingomonas guangdongensis TaxID=1141890 RepID=A0A285QET7_9SPHN|nr:methyltransferase domain-containing protein [Sphingomonas guangdongensis]SOB80356.1 Methyltransferase domain-containing protein [Sphingomonas guangdongensis]
MTLRHRVQAEERMDAEDLPPDVLAAVLSDLAQVNRVTLAARPTLTFLARALSGRTSVRLLDVGFGDGDLLRRIARWTAKRGIAAELIGIDLNPNSAPAARAHTPPGLPIEYRTGDYAALAGEPWDIVVSSLVAHHMSHAELVTFLRFMEAHARVGWHVNDLHRHRFAYLGYPLLARVWHWHEIVRHDGTLSIARSYRPAEWPPILAEARVSDARVYRAFPFRLCVERLR